MGVYVVHWQLGYFVLGFLLQHYPDLKEISNIEIVNEDDIVKDEVYAFAAVLRLNRQMAHILGHGCMCN